MGSLGIISNGKETGQTDNAAEQILVIRKELADDGVQEDVDLGIGYVDLSLSYLSHALTVEFLDLPAFGFKGIGGKEGKVAVFKRGDL